MLGKMICKIGESIKKTGKDDPRRITHCVKVGFALTVVSMLYYFRPLYQGFQQTALWAVLTVVVVFEYTAGGTLSKSLNRGFATLVAGALGVGAEYLADQCGKKGEPIVLGILVFLLGSTMTFTRFIPQIKKRYDYGVLIFILTFSLVTVSGYRVDEIIMLAHQRLSTILIGAGVCVIISVFVFPVWAGEDLHHLIAANIAKLADFFEGFAGKNINSIGGKDDKTYLEAFKSALNTKATEESLANLAWWEPRHGRFKFGHPWKQYLKMAGLTRQCAYLIQSLTACLLSQPQVESSENLRKIEEACRRICLEAGKALREISKSLKSMRHHSTTTIDIHLQNSISAMDDLKILLETLTLDKAKLTETMQVLTFASLLLEVIKCVENIAKTFAELSELASFTTRIVNRQVAPDEAPPPPAETSVASSSDIGDHDVVIIIRGGASEGNRFTKWSMTK